MMNEHEDTIDPDILKGREDIQRARKAERPGKLEKSPSRKIPQAPSPIMKAVVDANRQKHPQRGQSDIPVFDVSQKILARQRQSAASRRTAPRKMRQANIAGPVHIQTRIEYNEPIHNNLIADIVARDINRFFRG